MKILRDVDWSLVGYDTSYTKEGGFVFRHKRYGEYIIIGQAKYILTRDNAVLIFDNTSPLAVRVSHRSRNNISKSLVALIDSFKQSLKVEDEVYQLKSALLAQ